MAIAERKVPIGTYIIFIKTGATFIPVVCQTDTNLSQSLDVIDADTKCGEDKQPAPYATRELSGTGQILLGANGTTKASLATLQGLFDTKTSFSWQLGPMSGTPTPGDITMEGSGFLSKLDVKYPVKDSATFDFTISVQGQPTTTEEPEA